MGNEEPLYYDSCGGQGLPQAAHEHRMQLERLNASNPYELRAIVAEQRAALDALSSADDALKDVLNSATAKLETYEAGQDVTPRDEATMPTPGQLWHELLNAREDVRLAALLRLIENTKTATDCFMQDHQGAMMQLEGDREQLSIAVFDMPTLDSTSQLHTAVRALRQAIVDGIATRAVRIAYAEAAPAEDLDNFPVEKDVQAKIGDQLKTAGIDPQSVCGYTWETGTTDGLDSSAHEGCTRHRCGVINPLHSVSHECGCEETLTHEQAERLADHG